MTQTFGKADWMEKAEPFGYFRISDAKQSVEDRKQDDPKKKTTIKRQIKEVQDLLKSQGLPPLKKENIFAEVASGSKGERTQWRESREAALRHNGRAFIVVKDPSRWARNVDAAVIAWIPLKERDIPVYAIGTGIQTGTNQNKRPSENFIFLLNSGFAAQVSEIQSEKSTSGVKRQREEGAMAAKGRSVFPYALKDPYDAYFENKHLASISKSRHAQAIENATMPNGVKKSAAGRLIDDMARIETALTKAEVETFLAFRKRLAVRLKRIGFDSWATKGNEYGKQDYRSNALYRMSGNYLTNPQTYPMPSEKFLDAVEKDFVEYLSDKDKKRRGKRGL
jgi:DNA invertase Pin-like site-specific DNA recombinase